MYYCIVNPSARSGNGKNIYSRFEEKCKARAISYKVFFTKGPGHAMKISKRLTSDTHNIENGPINLIVMGGDGTLNEVISGIESFENVRLGIIPLGSGNDFARDMNLPKNIDVLLDTVLNGEVVRKLDIGNIHYNKMTKTFSRLHDERISPDRYFDVSCGIGFDAAVCEEALSSGTKNFLNRIGLGKLTYASIALRQLLNAVQPACDIETDDGQKVHFDHFIFAAAMIHHYEGGGFKFAPDADFSDGYFELIAAGDMKLSHMLKVLPLSYFGKHYGQSGIIHLHAKEITIRTELPLWVHTDGEVLLKSDSITISCMHRQLAMLL